MCPILLDANPSLPPIIMSHSPSTSARPPNFISVFIVALDVYRKRTKQDLALHPLFPILQACDSPDEILAVLREQIPEFAESQNSDGWFTKWLVPTANVLFVFSSMLGEGVGLVCIKMPPC
jgi:hypothetical protein